MNLLDIIVLVLVTWGLIKGLYNGLIKELLSLIGVGLALVLAYKYHSALQSLLKSHVQFEESTLLILTFASIFLCTLILTHLIAIAITKTLNYIAFGLLNRLLGGVFGTLKSIAFLTVVYHLVNPLFLNINDYEVLVKSSKTIPIIDTISHTVATLFF